MSAKVLHLANAALLGPDGRVGRVADAVVYLGLDTTEPDLQYLAGMDLAGRLPEWRELCRQTAADEVACD